MARESNERAWPHAWARYGCALLAASILTSAICICAGLAWRDRSLRSASPWHGEKSHEHAIATVGVLQPAPMLLPSCPVASLNGSKTQRRVLKMKTRVVLRTTAWGTCHWMWNAEWISEKVRDMRSYGPTRTAQRALVSLGPSAHLVDVGANVGIVTAAALAIGHNTTSIEGSDMNAALLHATIHLNGWESRARLIKRAVVADEARTPTVEFAGGPSSTNGMAAGAGHIRAAARTRGPSQTVHTVSLDGLLRDGAIPARAPLVVKLDIQGCEHAALSGGREVLAQTRVVLIELQAHGRQLAACGGSGRAILDLLQRSGFTHAFVDSGTVAHAIRWNHLEQRMEASPTHFDAIFRKW